MLHNNRPKLFVHRLVLWVSDEQNAFLDSEVARRKASKTTSDIAAAHGGNHHVNKGMLVREALERTFDIPPSRPVQVPGQLDLEGRAA